MVEVANAMALALVQAEGDLERAFALLGVGIAAGLASVGTGIGLGNLIGRTIETIGRQPEMSGELRTLMFIGIAFVEALGLYGVVFAILLAFVL